jgi:hypothetical protein
MLVISAFEIINSCHCNVCIRVDLIQISFTIQLSSHITIKSQISKGLSKNMLNDEKISLSIFCRAKAIPTHITHTLAIKGVISIHIFDNNNNHPVI